jgi:hypothetical protein
VQIDSFAFGSVRIDGHTYRRDVVIDRGQVRERRKGASKRHRESYGHTPLSAEEEIPWSCRRLVIGTGAAGAMPVMEAVRAEARRRHVELVTVPTEQASTFSPAIARTPTPSFTSPAERLCSGAQQRDLSLRRPHA